MPSCGLDPHGERTAGSRSMVRSHQWCFSPFPKWKYILKQHNRAVKRHLAHGHFQAEFPLLSQTCWGLAEPPIKSRGPAPLTAAGGAPAGPARHTGLGPWAGGCSVPSAPSPPRRDPNCQARRAGRQVTHCAGASCSARPAGPTPFSNFAAAGDGTVVRAPSMPSSLSGRRFPAAPRPPLLRRLTLRQH